MKNGLKKVLIWVGGFLTAMVYMMLLEILGIHAKNLGAIPYVLIVGIPSILFICEIPRRMCRKFCRTEEERVADKSWEEEILTEDEIHYTYHDPKNDPKNK